MIQNSGSRASMQPTIARCVTLFALYATLGGAGSASAQIGIDTIGGGIAWQLYPAPDSAPIVAGVVFETSGGTMEGALISVKGEGIGTITDSLGRFRIRLPGPGLFELEIAYVGYRSVVDSILMPPDFAAFATAVLRQGDPTLCGLVATSRHFREDDFNIEVLDSVSGEVPSVTVTLRVVQGDSAWERSHTLRRGDPARHVIGLGRPIATFGSHDVEIRAAGYELWRREGVELWLIEGCYPRLRNNSFVARLVPLRR